MSETDRLLGQLQGTCAGLEKALGELREEVKSIRVDRAKHRAAVLQSRTAIVVAVIAAVGPLLKSALLG
jgi:hypothetical protein